MSCGRACKYQPCEFPRCALERFREAAREPKVWDGIGFVIGVALTLGWIYSADAQELRHGPMLKPWAHVSNHRESDRTDCSTDSLGGIGWWVSKNGWEVEGTIGARRIRCGLRRDTGPGATFEIAKKWEWRR